MMQNFCLNTFLDKINWRFDTECDLYPKHRFVTVRLTKKVIPKYVHPHVCEVIKTHYIVKEFTIKHINKCNIKNSGNAMR